MSSTLAMINCGGSAVAPQGGGPLVASSVSVALAAPEVRVGHTVDARATVTDASGNVLSGMEVTWSSSAASVATVAVNGQAARITAHAPGSATITARAGSVSGSAELRVLPFAAFVAAQVLAGGEHTCARTAAGKAYCWGLNLEGEVGDGTAEMFRPFPTAVAGNHSFQQVTAGGFHSCGLTSNGDAWCWGVNSQGRLGNGAASGNEHAPVRVRGGPFADIAAGNEHTCARLTSGATVCWGRNHRGQLGDGTLTERPLPTPVSGNHSFVELATGWEQTCGRTATGAVYCWGQEGRVPVLVSTTLTFTSLTSDLHHTCGLSGSIAYCWGDNARGQLGDGTRITRNAPTPVAGGIAFVELSAGQAWTCGRTGEGAVWCWGDNRWGQLGDGTTVERLTPTRVAGNVVFAQIAAGGVHTCGRAVDSSVYCWGSNSEGAIGDGSFTDRLVPTRVLAPVGFAPSR